MKTNTCNSRVAGQQMPPRDLACCRVPAALLMLLASAVYVHAQFEYTIYDHMATITKYTGVGGEVVIPAKVPGARVISIGPSAFFDCATLTAVTIPEGVLSIGNSAFKGCSNLTNLSFPETLTSLGGRAFFGCTSLTSIRVPGSITNWPLVLVEDYPNLLSGSWVFADCTNLTTVTISDGVPSIPPYGFSGCVRLDTVLLPDTVSSIEGGAFEDCHSLTSVTIPNSVGIIKRSAFEDCHSLTEMVIPNSVTDLGAYAFRRCISLTDITIPGSITNWPLALVEDDPNLISGSWVFADCTNLAAVTIGDGISTIPPYGFSGCVRLVAVLLPNTVSNIEEGAFEDCHSLTGVAIPSSVTNIGNEAFYGCNRLTSITIPNSVTRLGRSAFARCTSLTSITIPGSVTDWGLTDSWYPPSYPVAQGWTFSGCTNLTTATIEDGVTNIPAYAFGGCVRLASISIPNSVTSIREGALDGCSSLTGVTIPNSVTCLGACAFSGCTGLTNLTIPGSVTNWEVLVEGGISIPPVYIPPFFVSWTFAGCTNLKTVMVEDGVTYIPPGAFAECRNLNCITIPRSVTSLGMLFEPPVWAWPIFSSCTELAQLCFEGEPPILLSGLIETSGKATVYYLPGTAGWGATYGGCPTALWTPQVQTLDSSFGAGTNGFGFTLSWARGKAVTVEACTDLLNPAWTPVRTLTLTNGSCYFTDPEWRNYPGRFYRLRSP